MLQQTSTAKIPKLGKADVLTRVIQKNKKLFVSYLLFLIIYCAFMLIPRPPQETLIRYHLSTLGVKLIYLTIIILLAVIWGAGFYGFAKLRTYTQLISKQKDGAAVEIISRGIFLLVMWLPVSQDISVILSYLVTHHPSWLSAVTIIDNYINLILPLAAFIFIGAGARGLSGLVKRGRNMFLMSNFLVLIGAYIGVVYSHLVVSTTNRSLVYHMSAWLIILTIVVPYVYMWFPGLLSITFCLEVRLDDS